jgi:hypothetical protein
MRKHPKRLTINVPQGKPCVQTFFIQVEMRYLKAPPTKLPMPTMHSDLIIFQFLFHPNLWHKVRNNMLTIQFKCKKPTNPSEMSLLAFLYYVLKITLRYVPISR